jgi:hypothetical protein
MGDRTRDLDVFGSPRVAALHWVQSVDELGEAGLTSEQVARLRAAGHLFRHFRGVYGVGRPELSFEGRCRAAWLACGPGSSVSHRSAAAVWGLRASTGAIHVTAPRGRRGHPGLVVHRPRSLPLDEIVRREDFAVTSVARTLLDMAAGASADAVGRWIHEAEVQRVLDVREVWAVLERHPHHRGRPRLEAALGLEVLGTRSGLEDLMVAIWRRAGLPAPRVNEHVWTADRLEEVDLHSRELRLIVEADGGRYHSSRWRRRRDAEKDARLRAAGWTVARFPELAITLEPAAVTVQLRRLAGLGLPNPSQGRVG